MNNMCNKLVWPIYDDAWASVKGNVVFTIRWAVKDNVWMGSVDLIWEQTKTQIQAAMNE